MIRAAEYKDHAQECRELAKRMLRPEDRDALERIAQIWERLETVSERHPDPELEPEHTERKTKGPGFESGPVESFAESVTRPYDVAARNFFILANAYRLQDISRSIPDLLLLITRGIIVECRPSSSRAYRCGGGSCGSPASVTAPVTHFTDTIDVATINVGTIDVATINIGAIDVGAMEISTTMEATTAVEATATRQYAIRQKQRTCRNNA